MNKLPEVEMLHLDEETNAMFVEVMREQPAIKEKINKGYKLGSIRFTSRPNMKPLAEFVFYKAKG